MRRQQLPDVQALGQVAGDRLQHVQVTEVLSRGGRQVIAVEVEAGPQGVLALAGRGHVTLCADHGVQGLALCSLAQAGDLPANAFERQVGSPGELAHIGSAGEDCHRRTGQQVLTVPGLPLAVVALQLQHGMVGQKLDVRVAGLPAAQRRRVHPAAFGEVQAAAAQADTRDGFGFGLLQYPQQVGGKGVRKLGLALGFLVVEGQLQYATTVPVGAPLQVFQQAPGVAETAED
ncbi:hypothetical protein D3C85_926580 [compost metagenome]